MKRIRVFPAPHIELRLFVSDEMVADYKNCAEAAQRTGEGKNCETCSWNQARLGDLCMCQLNEMERLLSEDCNEEEKNL